MTRRCSEPPTLEELQCLIMWPEGTNGAKRERALIDTLFYLCEEHGFGRVPQITAAIEDIWRNPENVKKYKKMQETHRKLIEGDIKKIKKINKDSK